MKSKATRTEIVLFFIAVILAGINLFILNYYISGLVMGILGSLNIIWYFSNILNNKSEKYTYKGNTYTFNYYCSFKHPENRRWVTAVNYSDKAGNKYIREISEFNKLFVNE